MPATLTSAAEEVIVYLLKSNEQVQELVSARIVPDQLPIDWKDKTSIVYEQQSDKRQRLISGRETGLIHASFAIYCIDRNRGKSRILAKAAREALATNLRQTIAEVDVCQVFVKDGERDESLPGADGQDVPERYRTLDVIVHYNAN
jgi:hypothetical protein